MASTEAAAAAAPASTVEQDKYSRLTVPSFPIEWAVALCTCNFIVPGLGTLMAGLTLCLPCSNKRDFDCGDTCCSACIQLGIALMQLLLTPVCLIGWIWSCVWGFAFIGQSGHDNRHDTVANGPGVVVVATATTTQPAPSSGVFLGGSGYLNYAFHFKAPVAVHPFGPPPAYSAEAPPPPYEIGAVATASAASASTSASAAASTSACGASIIVQQPQPVSF